MGKERAVNFRELLVKVLFLLIIIIQSVDLGGNFLSFLVQMCVNVIVRCRGNTCVC